MEQSRLPLPLQSVAFGGVSGLLQGCFIAALISSPALLFRKSSLGFWLSCFLWIMGSLTSLVHLITYTITGKALALYAIDGGIQDFPVLWDSITSRFFSNYGIQSLFFISALIFIFRKNKYLFDENAKCISQKGRLCFILIISLGGGAAGLFSALQPTSHPVFSILKSSDSSRPENLSHCSLHSDLYTPIQVTSEKKQIKLDPPHFKQSPDILHILIESAGAIAVLENGLPKKRFKTLSKLSQKGVVFSQIYSTFPSSVRSVLEVQTGGNKPTLDPPSVLQWGYKGPTLVSELKKQNYFSAFIMAHVSVENFDRVIAMPGFDFHFEAGNPDRSRFLGDLPPQYSWGYDEFSILPVYRAALKQAPANKPFFLQTLTLSSHHPYRAGPTDQSILDSDLPWDRYMKSLDYTDRFIQQLIQEFKAMRRARPLLILISGDHGEAFGDLHAGNYGHIGEIYEENVKNFLILSSDTESGDAWKPKARLIERVGEMADIAPTLTSIAGLKSNPFQGQNLFDPTYARKITYFLKHIGGTQCGLRDGDWKFLGKTGSQNQAKLFQISQDPFEKNDLAAQHPDWVLTYECLCQNWYTEQNKLFISQLNLNPHSSENKSVLVELKKTYTPFDHPTARIQSLDPTKTPHEREIELQWISPIDDSQAAKTEKILLNAKPIEHPLKTQFPMPSGDWRLLWKDVATGEQGVVRFEVRPLMESDPIVQSLKKGLKLIPGVILSEKGATQPKFMPSKEIPLRYPIGLVLETPTSLFPLILLMELHKNGALMSRSHVEIGQRMVLTNMPDTFRASPGEWKIRLSIRNGPLLNETFIVIK